MNKNMLDVQPVHLRALIARIILSANYGTNMEIEILCAILLGQNPYVTLNFHARKFSGSSNKWG